jgi:hypothetical protein
MFWWYIMMVMKLGVGKRTSVVQLAIAFLHSTSKLKWHVKKGYNMHALGCWIASFTLDGYVI